MKNHLLWKNYRSFSECESAFAPGQNEHVIYDEDLDALWKEFKGEFEVIEASGGIVKNPSGELLFIYRHDKWDLPKGKIERGESREEAAFREVTEECGFASLDLGPFLGTTYHIYTENGTDVLKASHWYEMFSDDSELTPQREEGITELAWVDPRKLNSVFSNTYPNIILLMELYKKSRL